jgi:hypothetical protein
MVLGHTSHVVRVGNLFLIPTMLKHDPTTERSLGDQIEIGPAVTLGHLIPPPTGQLGVGKRGFDQVIT